MTEGNKQTESSEQDVERMLRIVGPRVTPPDELKRLARAAVHAEWRSVVAARRARSRLRTTFALAASVALAAFALWIGRPSSLDSDATVAALVLVTGEVVRSNGGFLGHWRPVTGGEALRAGQELRTGADGRAALLLGQGVSLRLDRATRIALLDPERIAIEEGAVYVDAGAEPAQGDRLMVITPGGTVRHVGTQYEVRLLGPDVRIRVREGQVELRSPSGAAVHGRAGEQLLVSARGTVERNGVVPYGQEWTWVGETAAVLDIEGRPLLEFLEWASRELGRELVFADDASRAQAAEIVLSGSVAGLAPLDALTAVLSTTRLRSAEHQGQLVIAEAPASH